MPSTFDTPLRPTTLLPTVEIPVLPENGRYYKPAFAPCFPYTSVGNNLTWFMSLNKVGQAKFLDQVYTELVFCAYFRFDESFRDRTTRTPKFASSICWLVSIYRELSLRITNPTQLQSDRAEWAYGLHNFCIDNLNHQEYYQKPRCFVGDINLLKERMMCMIHFYRFQLETRALRKLSASRYRTFEYEIRGRLSELRINWTQLDSLNRNYNLYPQSLGVCRRNQNVLDLCGLISDHIGVIELYAHTDLDIAMNLHLMKTYLATDREEVFNTFLRILNPRGASFSQWQTNPMIELSTRTYG